MPSRAPKGSSSSIAGRPSRTVRRNAARWRMPPESCHGQAGSKPPRPKRSSSGRACARARGAPHAGELEPDRDVVDRAPPGQQRVALGHEGARAEPARRRRAVEADLAARRRRSSPARIWKSVLLPAPLGPISATNSPGSREQVDAVEGQQRRRSPASRVDSCARHAPRSARRAAAAHHDAARLRRAGASAAPRARARRRARTARASAAPLTITAPNTRSVLPYWLARRHVVAEPAASRPTYSAKIAAT